MAQRKPTSSQPVFQLVRNDATIIAPDPLSAAMHRHGVRPSIQLQAQRQAAAMELRAERAKFAISKTLEVHDYAAGEATASLLYVKHILRGFAAGELTEEEEQFYAAIRHMILEDSVAITTDTAATLRALARDLALPATTVARWEAFIADLLSRW